MVPTVHFGLAPGLCYNAGALSIARFRDGRLEMYEILATEDLMPITKRYEIRAPEVAQKARAGQFVIIRNGADQALMTRRQK